MYRLETYQAAKAVFTVEFKTQCFLTDAYHNGYKFLFHKKIINSYAGLPIAKSPFSSDYSFNSHLDLGWNNISTVSQTKLNIRKI